MVTGFVPVVGVPRLWVTGGAVAALEERNSRKIQSSGCTPVASRYWLPVDASPLINPTPKHSYRTLIIEYFTMPSSVARNTAVAVFSSANAVHGRKSQIVN